MNSARFLARRPLAFVLQQPFSVWAASISVVPYGFEWFYHEFDFEIFSGTPGGLPS